MRRSQNIIFCRAHAKLRQGYVWRRNVGALALRNFCFGEGWGGTKALNQAPSPKTPFYVLHLCREKLEVRKAIRNRPYEEHSENYVMRTKEILIDVNSHRCKFLTMERTNHGVKHVLPDNYN